MPAHRVLRSCAGLLLSWALQAAVPAPAAAAPTPPVTGSGMDKFIRAHVKVENQTATRLGPHTLTLTNGTGRPLDFRLLRIEDRPARGNGIEARIDSFHLEPMAQQQIPYTVSTNADPQDHPFGMSRTIAWEVTPTDRRALGSSTVTVVLSAHLDVARILRVAVPAVGEAASYKCAAVRLEQTPPELWPVHCRNALADAQAGAYPLNVYLSPVDPADLPYIRPLWVDRLYRTRYVDGREEPLNCPCECEVDFAGGKHGYSFLPANPRLGYVLEPVVPGLPWISRRMQGDEPDVVLEVERRPDLMDPLTRVDTLHAACLGPTCSADDAIVIDEVERVDDVEHGFAPPPPAESRRYAPNGEIGPGTTLTPGGPHDKGEVAFRITDAAPGRYVESHYVVRYHGRGGMPREFTSPHFGGILESATQRERAARAAASRLRADPPPWVHDQLPGPFVRVELPDASSTRRTIDWATPPLDTHVRLLSALITEPYGGSGSVVGLPELGPDDSVESLKVLTALHLLVPLFHQGLTAEEYTRRYTAPIEVVLSSYWFGSEYPLWYDPTEVEAAGAGSVLGQAFRNGHNATIEVSALPLPDMPGSRIPDVLVYTVHPTEPMRLNPMAWTGLPMLDYDIQPRRDPLLATSTLLGYPQAARYRLDPSDPASVELLPMVGARFPALRNAPDPSFALNSRALSLGGPGSFRYSVLDPRTGQPIRDGDDLLVFQGFSGAPLLSDLLWGEDVLMSATVRGVATSVGISRYTQESYLSYAGFDVDMSSLDAQIYYEWLKAKLP